MKRMLTFDEWLLEEAKRTEFQEGDTLEKLLEDGEAELDLELQEETEDLGQKSQSLFTRLKTVLKLAKKH